MRPLVWKQAQPATTCVRLVRGNPTCSLHCPVSPRPHVPTVFDRLLVSLCLGPSQLLFPQYLSTSLETSRSLLSMSLAMFPLFCGRQDQLSRNPCLAEELLAPSKQSHSPTPSSEVPGNSGKGRNCHVELRLPAEGRQWLAGFTRDGGRASTRRPQSLLLSQARKLRGPSLPQPALRFLRAKTSQKQQSQSPKGNNAQHTWI